jgi:hypothetical protein
MASLSLDEFHDALALLTDGGSAEKLRDRLARLNAFHSRRGLNSLRALTERLYALSSGLRRDVAPTRAFQALWLEHIGHRLTEKVGEKLDELAEQINSHLLEDGSIKDGEQGALGEAISEYEELLARKVGGAAARLDTLQKAVPAVAAILRTRAPLEVPLDPPEEDDEHDHDHHHAHDHDHRDDHDHPHDHAHAHRSEGAAGTRNRKKGPGEDPDDGEPRTGES